MSADLAATESPGGATGPNQLIWSFLSNRDNPRLRRAIQAALMAKWGYGWVKPRVLNWRNAKIYTVTIDSDDDLYGPLHDWILSKIPARDQKSIVARSSRQTKRYFSSESPELCSPDDYDDQKDSPAGRLWLNWSGANSVDLDLEGHKISVNLAKAGKTVDLEALMSSSKPFQLGKDEIQLKANDHEGFLTLKGFLESLVSDIYSKEKRTPDFFISSGWGSWRRRNDVPRRTMESVILREGQAEALVEDLTEFLRREQDYVTLGIPWHRGYLFHGAPGSGKTSLAKALATHFDLSVYYCPLQDMKSDSDLMALVSDINPQSMLLLEDIDTLHAARERDAEGEPLSMSALLNALDGFSTPHGLITVMTTNHLDVLDEAVVRPGRIDRLEYVGELDDDQMERLFQSLYRSTPTSLPSVDGANVMPAEVVEIFKCHIGDPEAATKALWEKFGGRDVGH